MTEESQSLPVMSEGKNVKLFRVRMRGFFEKIATGVSVVEFEEIFKDVLQGRQSLARRLHKVWQESILNALVEDLDEVIVEEKLDEHLKNRERIIEDCQERNNTAVQWRSPENVEECMRSHYMLKKIKKKKELEAFVKTKEEEVNQLMKEISDRRAEIQKYSNHLQRFTIKETLTTGEQQNTEECH